MIRELAHVLGMEEHALHGAIHEAARLTGRAGDGVVVSTSRDVFDVPDGMVMRHSPAKESVVVIYGPAEKVNRLGATCAESMKELGL